jgi:hypothetical protein
LFNTFIDDVIDYTNVGNTLAPAAGTMSIAGLLFADDLAIGSFTVNGLQKGINKLTKFCNDWSIKCNLKKIGILVCKKGGKRRKTKRWFMQNQQIELVKEVNYSGVTLYSSGGCSKQKAKQKIEGIQSLVANDKCL